MNLHVLHPKGAFSLPSGWIYLRYNDGTYEAIANVDVVDPYELDFVKQYIENSGHADDIMGAIFVDPTGDRYYNIYPVFSPYYDNLKYIEYQLKERRHKR